MKFALNSVSRVLRMTASTDPAVPDTSPDTPAISSRLSTAGKMLRRGGERVFLNGLTYGPFGPAEDNAGLPERGRALADLDMIAGWGANALRLYIPPEEWFIESCAARGITIMSGMLWADHLDFLHSHQSRREAVERVRQAARRLAPHPAVGALLVGNEIQAQMVRYMGARRVLGFLEDLIDAARQEAPETLIAYANYPTTEYLQPANADFTACNVYLEKPEAYSAYLSRLQNVAGDKPLVISEFGVDAQQHGAAQQAQVLTWQRRITQELGAVGNFVFAFSDAWHRGGQMVEDWSFGLTDKEREPRAAWTTLAGGMPPERSLLPAGAPRVSIVICTRNGVRTLGECLRGVQRLDYPDWECIVVDDGSTEDIAGIVRNFSGVRYIRQEAQGLSVARNAGAAAATGSIIAYTDDDCVPDEAWLIHLVRVFLSTGAGAAGGPNVPPAPQNQAQACVIAAPGGPAHVLLTDTTAEHVPGCNMAVRKSVLEAVGGFKPRYHAAGDDVDFCWRLLEMGETIGFAPAAMVWHYRRFTVGAFLRQQAGYGKAEALLTSRHSARFGQLGGARWRGVVYQPALRWLAHRSSRIYTGVFGSASYQSIYGAPASEIGWLITGFPWWLLTAAVALNALWLPWLGWVAAGLAAVPVLYAAGQAAVLPLATGYGGLRGRVLLWFLLLAQPLVRGWSRFWWNRKLGASPGGPWLALTPESRPRRWPWKRVASLSLWHEQGKDRQAVVDTILRMAPESGTDDGWRDWDVEVPAGRWWRVRYATMTEYHPAGRTLTKVRLATRATREACVIYVVSAVLALGVLPLLNFHPLWALGILFAWAMLFETRHHAAVTLAANDLVRACREEGFSPVLD